MEDKMEGADKMENAYKAEPRDMTFEPLCTHIYVVILNLPKKFK